MPLVRAAAATCLALIGSDLIEAIKGAREPDQQADNFILASARLIELRTRTRTRTRLASAQRSADQREACASSVGRATAERMSCLNSVPACQSLKLTAATAAAALTNQSKASVVVSSCSIDFSLRVRVSAGCWRPARLLLKSVSTSRRLLRNKRHRCTWSRCSSASHFLRVDQRRWHSERFINFSAADCRLPTATERRQRPTRGEEICIQR